MQMLSASHYLSGIFIKVCKKTTHTSLSCRFWYLTVHITHQCTTINTFPVGFAHNQGSAILPGSS